jgi:hypothetical protein
MRLRIGTAIRGLVDHDEKVTFGENIAYQSDKVVIAKIGSNNTLARQIHINI